jgi:chemotaxis protein CheZ
MTEASKSGYGREQVVKIINSVITKIENVGGDERLTIYRELKNVKDVIDQARREIGAVRASDINNKHISSATDELDAVVQATADATGTIMDACDALMEQGGALGGAAGDEITNQVTKIYEACSFQDITGQRITKVVTTLRTIEDKVNRLVTILSEKLPVEEDSGEEEDKRSTEEKLLNGPQLAGQGISQDDIDKLLSDF